MTTIDQLDWQETVDLLCFSAARQILAGVSFAEFRDRMEGMVGLLLNAGGVPKEAQLPEMLRSMATMVAREIGNVTPVPENRFRPRKQPKPERNAPCLCGSGKKFKHCCAAVDGPELGISEELMLSKVHLFAQAPARTAATGVVAACLGGRRSRLAGNGAAEGRGDLARKAVRAFAGTG